MPTEQPESQEAQIGRIINEYLDRKQKGDAVGEDELLRAHPDFADELREHFRMIRQVISVSPAGNGNAVENPALPADFLPGYEIEGEIHRGGQGVVYRALQKATRRKVAIKVTREGPFAGWRDRARFEREVHVLAALKHPCIVTIHDSGVAAGCQYFVMDYISGSPLDIWLTAAPRTTKQILTLFVSICDAINAAHIKGIIHRDLKPGNIRMDETDSPHILDFGLAKVTSEPDVERAGMTAIGQFVGSLPWTGPEQAQGLLDQIDTRTDVYALGVILYQMLTGSFPYEVAGPVRDVLNRIVVSDPAAPSTIRSGIDKDVDAIVLKCLRKEPHRRYQTAGELGQDIQRYLSGLPVAARSDSGLYVLRKMLRRYRVPAAVATAFAVLVTASLLASLSLWRRAATERDRAISAERVQDQERRRADAQAVKAQQALSVAESERAIAQEQTRQLRRSDYRNLIARAQNASDQNNTSQVQPLLDSCPADLREWEWYYLSRLSRSPVLLNMRADSDYVSALAISPDGQRIAGGGRDGIIRIWDAQTGAPLTELKGNSFAVKALRWSPDGGWIASGGLDKTLRLWDSHTYSQRLLEQGREYVNGVDFSPDSTCLVSGGLSRTLTFWDVSSGQVLRRTPAESGEVSCVAYSPDGKWVVSGEYLNPLQNKTIKTRLWEVSTGQSRPLVEHPASVLCVAFSPDGARIASGSGMPSVGGNASGTLKICNAATGQELLSLRGHEGTVEALAFSPDGRLLASAGTPRIANLGADSDHTLKIWDTVSGAEHCTYSAHARGGKAVAWGPDPARVFSGGGDGRVKAWPSTPPPPARVLQGHTGPALRVAFSPDGRRIASASGQTDGDRPPIADTSVRVWDQATGAQLLLLTGHRGAVLGLAWSPDGKHLASADTQGAFRLWDSNSGQLQGSFTIPNQSFQAVAFSHDTAAPGLVASMVGSTATLRNIADGKEYARLQHSAPLMTIAFSSDARWTATASENGDVRVWNTARPVEYRAIAAGSGLSGVVFTPDGKALVTARTNGTIALWDLLTERPPANMAGPPVAVQGIALSPDGLRLASCTSDNMLRIWDVQSTHEVCSFRAHDARIMWAAFSPDNRQLATSSQDGVIKIWDGEVEPTTQPVRGSAND